MDAFPTVEKFVFIKKFNKFSILLYSIKAPVCRELIKIKFSGFPELGAIHPAFR